MNADDAFGQLIRKNALAIPVANPSGDPGLGDGVGPGPNAPGGDALRVSELLDDAPRDYRPGAGDTVDEESVAYTSPTETDLDEIEPEYMVRVPAAGSAPAAPRLRAGGDDEEPEDFGPPPGSPFDGSETGLDLARRVRRLAYLPLREMEDFESRSRDLMAGLQSRAPERPSLAVTGVRDGDGETEIAIRLALAMAKRVDYRVLLADFDLRRPRIASRLGLSSKHFTIADVLRGSCPLGEALILGEEDNLYVLPARPSDRDGDEFLDDRQVRSLLSLLHRTFDFSIIACGSMDNADATTICRHAGSSALVGYCGLSRARPLRDAADRLADAGARVAGLVLTGA